MSDLTIWLVVAISSSVLIAVSMVSLLRLVPTAYPQARSSFQRMRLMMERHKEAYFLLLPVFVFLCLGGFGPGFDLAIAFGTAVAITHSEASQAVALREASAVPRPAVRKDLAYIGLLFLNWIGNLSLLAAVVGLACDVV